MQTPTDRTDAFAELVRLTARRVMREAEFAPLMARLAERRGAGGESDELLAAYAESRAESRFEGARSEPPDCLTCGACCAHFQRVPVLISDPTPRRLVWRVEDEDADGEALEWLRREAREGRCVALAGEVGQNSRCAIYELRPRACRDFDAGSDRCHAIRRLYGLEKRLPEEAERARIAALDLSAFEREARAIEEMEAAAPRGALEQARFFESLFEYNQARFAEIAAEARRLTALLEARGRAAPAPFEENEMKKVSAALASLRAINDLDQWREPELAALNQQLLAVARASQTASRRAAEQLVELGEAVFDALRYQLPEEAMEGTNGE